MSMIKISCPSCKAALKIAEEKLTETQGRVVCHECQHIFRLVKKSKKAPPPAPTKPFDDLNDDDDLPIKSAIKPKLKPQDVAKLNLPPLHYRVPKAEAKTPFAEVGSDNNPIAFNLLDYKTANQQISGVNINPPMVAGDVSASGDLKNNITIHTGSLVFTLTNDGQANASNGDKFAEVPMNNQQTAALLAAATNARSELNWTIAVIVALVFLIVQLFYLVLMLA